MKTAVSQKTQETTGAERYRGIAERGIGPGLLSEVFFQLSFSAVFRSFGCKMSSLFLDAIHELQRIADKLSRDCSPSATPLPDWSQPLAAQPCCMYLLPRLQPWEAVGTGRQARSYTIGFEEFIAVEQ